MGYEALYHVADYLRTVDVIDKAGVNPKERLNANMNGESMNEGKMWVEAIFSSPTACSGCEKLGYLR